MVPSRQHHQLQLDSISCPNCHTAHIRQLHRGPRTEGTSSPAALPIAFACPSSRSYRTENFLHLVSKFLHQVHLNHCLKRALSQAQSHELQSLLYINPCSYENPYSPAETEAALSGSAACCDPGFGQVGIDTLNLMVVDPEVRKAFSRLSRRAFHCLQQRLRALGIQLRRFGVGRQEDGAWMQSNQFMFSLSVARLANWLSHGHHHNSYVASVGEMGKILQLLSQECLKEGVLLDPLRLLTIRLDLFKDALLERKSEAYVNMLMLLSSSGRLDNGLCYLNGIYGAGKTYSWIFYGKGILLLERAESDDASSTILEELREKCCLELWEYVCRVEMRWTRSSSVRCATAKRNAKAKRRAATKRGDRGSAAKTICTHSRRLKSPDCATTDHAATDHAATDHQDIIESMADAPEEGMPRFTLGELMEQWDRLPELFAKTARRRCLPLSMSQLEKKIAGAESQGSTSKCPRAQWQASFTAALGRRSIALPEGFFEKLYASLDLSASRGQDWLLKSPICRLRHYLKECSFKPNSITYYCQTFLWAELEYDACNGSDLLRQIQEFEKAYQLDAKDASRQKPQTERAFEPPLERESCDSFQAVNRAPLPRSFRGRSSREVAHCKHFHRRHRASARPLTGTRRFSSAPICRPRCRESRNRGRRCCPRQVFTKWYCRTAKREEHLLAHTDLYSPRDYRLVNDEFNARPP